MIRILITILIEILRLYTNTLEAQVAPKKMEVGLNISQFQNDFGVGLHFISPYFFKSKVAFRAGANIQWLENFNGTETTWTVYQNLQLGLKGRNAIIIDKIFIYGEGGVVTILPNNEFSSVDMVFGGYGLFGFEFKPIPTFSYFIELGSVGTGATADRIVGHPIYSNGFLTNVGFRIGF